MESYCEEMGLVVNFGLPLNIFDNDFFADQLRRSSGGEIPGGSVGPTTLGEPGPGGNRGCPYITGVARPLRGLA